MPVTERICPMCQEKVAVWTKDADDQKPQSGHCPHCHITLKFEHRTSFAVSARSRAVRS